MTVGELRAILAELPDDMPVEVGIDDRHAGELSSPTVKARCGDQDKYLYLLGELPF